MVNMMKLEAIKKLNITTRVSFYGFISIIGITFRKNKMSDLTAIFLLVSATFGSGFF